MIIKENKPVDANNIPDIGIPLDKIPGVIKEALGQEGKDLPPGIIPPPVETPNIGAPKESKGFEEILKGLKSLKIGEQSITLPSQKAFYPISECRVKPLRGIDQELLLTARSNISSIKLEEGIPDKFKDTQMYKDTRWESLNLEDFLLELFSVSKFTKFSEPFDPENLTLPDLSLITLYLYLITYGANFRFICLKGEKPHEFQAPITEVNVIGFDKEVLAKALAKESDDTVKFSFANGEICMELSSSPDFYTIWKVPRVKDLPFIEAGKLGWLLALCFSSIRSKHDPTIPVEPASNFSGEAITNLISELSPSHYNKLIKILTGVALGSLGDFKYGIDEEKKLVVKCPIHEVEIKTSLGELRNQIGLI